MNSVDHGEFLTRCLNAAANLYGVLTFDEFIGMFNGYLKERGQSDKAISADDLAARIDEIIDRCERADELGMCLDDVWFGRWNDPESGIDYVVYHDLLDDDDPDGRISRVRNKWKVQGIRILTEAQLLAYEDPSFGEECAEVDQLVDILEPYEEDREMAELAASIAQSEMRVNGANIIEGLLYLREDTAVSPNNVEEYHELLDVLARIASVTRTWNYRGYTEQELIGLGLMKEGETHEQVPDFHSFFHDDGEGGDYEDIDPDDYEDVGDPGVAVRRLDDSFEDSMSISTDDLPPAEYTGPIDFKFVKDAARRDKVLADYQKVRKLTQMFVRTFVMAEMTPEERKAACRRLGFDKSEPKNDIYGWTEQNRDIVAGDFGSMMDDQNGEPAIRRLLTQGIMDERTKKISAYYRNYRYTWLEVLAAKSGVGLKCRDLMTGEELFLMETSTSKNPDIKGMTLCCGIAPMGEVYLALGAIQPANFENPSVILKIVLTHLKLPIELPIKLTFSQQAEFAAETIRRLDANGKFATVHY